MWLARRGKLIGLLFWPGALMYVLYNHVAYVRAMPLGWALLLHIALVSSSAYATAGVAASIDAEGVGRRLAGAVPARFCGGILVCLGVLFLLLVVATVGGAIVNRTPLPDTDLAVQMADSMLVPAWVIGGVMLWQRKAWGYVSGAALLFQGSMLFVGVIAFVLLQPVLTGAPLAWGDLIVLCVMGLICFVPLGLFVRGILKSSVHSRS